MRTVNQHAIKNPSVLKKIPPANRFSSELKRYVRDTIAMDMVGDVDRIAKQVKRYEHNEERAIETFYYRDEDLWVSLNEISARKTLMRIVGPLTHLHTSSRWVASPDDEEDEIRFVRKDFLLGLLEFLGEFVLNGMSPGTNLVRFFAEHQDAITLTENSSLSCGHAN